MNEVSMDADMFSSMEGELISNIKHPSFLSFSSEDSLDEKVGIETTTSSSYFQTSTPLKRDLVDDTICEKSDEGLEEYHFKIPGDGPFPSSRSGKRYSLSSFNEASRLYHNLMNKSSSMQDVSSLASSSFCPLRRDSCLFSSETLQSNSIATTKSKDSGFQRSTSCTSLTTNASKKYDHVQSKVKQYIQTIKQTEALRKMQKKLEKKTVTAGTYEEMTAANAAAATTTTTSADSADVSQSASPDSSPVSKRDLLQKLKVLEEELKERDCVIEQLERNQSELRLKYAAAENQIDDLRIRASVHDDPFRNYISDEKVAELLTSNAQISSSRKYVDNAVTKQLMCGLRREDVPAFARSTGGSAAAAAAAGERDLQPVTKFGSTSTRMTDEYPVLKSAAVNGGILKSSSSKCLKDERRYHHHHHHHYLHHPQPQLPNHHLSKSASNVERTASSVRFADADMIELPYEKNSFAKVQQWQRSLVNLNKHHDDDNDTADKHAECSHYSSSRRTLSSKGEMEEEAHFCVNGLLMDDSAEENHHKVRRYQKNKDADKRRYQRKSYPVGCRCEKYKCKSKEDLRSGMSQPPVVPALRGVLVRSVSFASCEDSLTSSLYDDGGSSSDSSAPFGITNKHHESYKEYKQRKLQQHFDKLSLHHRDRSPRWTRAPADLQKTKSANNLVGSRGGVVGSGIECVPLSASQQRSKRLLDNVVNSSYEYSCSSDRKHQQQCSAKSHPHNHHHHPHQSKTTKYRKLDDCTKVASSDGCNALVKCCSAHTCQPTSNGGDGGGDGGGAYEDSTCIRHSKSLDTCARGHDKKMGHRLVRMHQAP